MKKLFLFAAVAGLGLVSASPPGPEDVQGPDEARTGYPPCSATVSDECIQLHERGVGSRENLAENRHRERHRERRREELGMAEGDEPAPAPAGSSAGSSHYPPCTAAVKDECRQHRALARRIRVAGERG